MKKRTHASRHPAEPDRASWGYPGVWSVHSLREGRRRRKPSTSGDVAVNFAAKGTGLRGVTIGSHSVERIRKRDRLGNPIAARKAKKTLRLERRRNPAITEETGNASPWDCWTENRQNIPRRSFPFRRSPIQEIPNITIHTQAHYSEWRVKFAGKQSCTGIVRKLG